MESGMKRNSIFLIFLLVTLTACNTAPTPTPKPAVKAPTEALTFKNTVVSLTFDDGNADNYAIRNILIELSECFPMAQVQMVV